MNIGGTGGLHDGERLSSLWVMRECDVGLRACAELFVGAKGPPWSPGCGFSLQWVRAVAVVFVYRGDSRGR